MTKTALRGRLAQPWIDLEPYLDIDSLALQSSRIWACLAASQSSRWTSIVGAQGNLWDQSRRELGDYARAERSNPLSPYRAILDQLPPGPVTNQFFRFVRPDLAHLNDCVHLSAPSSYESKHLSRACHRTPAAEHWQFLFDWIRAQAVFEQWGRVVIFIANPGEQSILHKDYPDDLEHDDEFIWIDLTKSKQFFIWDSARDQEYPVTSRAAWFNNSDWHGSHPAEKTTYSIRIDGVFTTKFRDLLERGSA